MSKRPGINFSRTSSKIICGCILLVLMGPAALGLAASQSADRFIEDKFVFAGTLAGQPTYLVLTISRGTTERDGHKYAAECTGHLFRQNRWLHIGPGLYEWPETSLTVIPCGPGLIVEESAFSAGYDIEICHRTPAVHLRTGRLGRLYSDTMAADYCQFYDSGPATLVVGEDTVAGEVLRRRLDFTGYNRLVGNTKGCFPGKAELTFLTSGGGPVFVFVTDPVAALEVENRLRTNFAIASLPRPDTTSVFYSVITYWPEVDDTLYPGKPVPQRWKIDVGGGLWDAEYLKGGHFFYFTGFGIFGVAGTVTYADSVYQVIGVVEHIHARDNPR